MSKMAKIKKIKLANSSLAFKYQMMAVAELYIQKPDDPMFKKFRPEAMKGIKLLAEALQKARKEGKIK